MSNRAIIFDLDGTLCTMNERSPYDWARVGEDRQNRPITHLARCMFDLNHHIIVLSGRDAVCRPETTKWLRLNNVRFHELHMRPEGDNRRDSIVKKELYDKHIKGKHNVLFVVDDRDQVVKMWRELGLTCLQVADGDF